MGPLFRYFDLPLWIIVTGCAILIGSAVVTGHRIHRWLFYNFPSIGRNLPTDAGAWLGLSFGLLAVYLALTG